MDAQTGEIAVAHRFDEVEPYSAGYAAVRVADRWGFIDTQGEVVVEPRFEQVDVGFDHTGTAVVMMPSGKSGIIDREGDWVIEPQLGGLGGRTFNDVRVRRSGGSWGYVDASGRWRADEKAKPSERSSDAKNGISKCDDGTAVLWGDDGGLRGKDGEMMFADRPYHVDGCFADGRAVIYVGDDSHTAERGYIDATGEVVIEPRYRWAGRFSEERAIVCNWDEAAQHSWCGIIDPRGELLVPMEIRAHNMHGPTRIHAFASGHAVVDVAWAGGPTLLSRHGEWRATPDLEGAGRYAPRDGLVPFKHPGTAVWLSRDSDILYEAPERCRYVAWSSNLRRTAKQWALIERLGCTKELRLEIEAVMRATNTGLPPQWRVKK